MVNWSLCTSSIQLFLNWHRFWPHMFSLFLITLSTLVEYVFPSSYWSATCAPISWANLKHAEQMIHQSVVTNVKLKNGHLFFSTKFTILHTKHNSWLKTLRIGPKHCQKELTHKEDQ